MSILRRIGVFVFSTLLCAAATAQAAPQAPAAKPKPGAEQDRPHHGPPPEALAACKPLANGASCSFTSPRGAHTGTCVAPQGKPLACRPAGAPPGHGPETPPKK